jgi:hypothetical protein
MAADNQLDNDNLIIDEEAGNHIAVSGKWARFIGILVMAFFGLALLSTLFAASEMGRALKGYVPFLGLLSNSIELTVLFMLLGIGIGGYTYYQLYSFGQRAPQAVAQNDGEGLANSLRSLKLFFILSTIVSLLSLIFTLYGTFKLFTY